MRTNTRIIKDAKTGKYHTVTLGPSFDTKADAMREVAKKGYSHVDWYELTGFGPIPSKYCPQWTEEEIECVREMMKRL